MKDMELAHNFCPNQECPDYGKKGRGNLVCSGTYGPRQTKLLCCRSCGTRFSERRNTLFFGLHTDEDTIEQVVRCLAEGKSIRLTAKQMGINKNTVQRIYERAGIHCQRVLTELMRDLRLEDYPLEGIWGLLGRKRNNNNSGTKLPKNTAFRNWQSK
jgi:hypothetical protein